MGAPHFLLLAAMPEERQPFLEAAVRVSPTDHHFAGSRELTPVEIGGIPGEILVTGVGPVAAATALAAYFSTREAPKRIVSVGSAGGLHPNIDVGMVVIGTRYRYADVDAQAFGYEFGQVPRMPAEFVNDLAFNTTVAGDFIHAGLLVTSSSFISAELAKPIQTQFPDALAVDMESAALAQTCHLFGYTGFVSVRGISDLCTPQAGKDFHDGLGLAAARSREITLTFLTAT